MLARCTGLQDTRRRYRPLESDRLIGVEHGVDLDRETC